MSHPSAHAAWRAAPLRLLRTPAWCAVVTLGVVLLVASFVAPPLFVAAARTAALETVLGATSGSGYSAGSPDLRASWDGVLGRSEEQALLDRLDALPGWGAPRVGALGRGATRGTPARAEAAGRTTSAELFTHDGLLEALGGDPASTGIWLSATSAAELGVAVGDPVRIGLQSFADPQRAAWAETVLDGTYETGEGTVLPAAVAGDPGTAQWVLPGDPNQPGSSVPLAITGRSGFAALVPDAGESVLYLADLALDPAITPGTADRAVAQVAALGEESFNSLSPLAESLAQALPTSAHLDLSSGLPDVTAGADATTTAAQRQVRPWSVAAQVLAAALLLAAWVLVGAGRRREQVLASDLGVRPGELAGLAALEVVVVCAAAVPLGTGLALLGVRAAGPAGTTPPLTGGDLARAAVVAAAACLLVALVTAVAAVLTDRRAGLTGLGSGRRGAPWFTGLLAVTAACAAVPVVLDLDDRGRGVLSVVLPVLVATSTAAVAARVRGLLVPRRAGRGTRPGSPRWLAARRGAGTVRETAALTVVLGLALGLLGWCLAVRQGIDEGAADKLAALSGAPTTVAVTDDLRGGGTERALDPPFAGSSVVWRQSPSLPPAFGSRALLAVDVASLRAVADWGGSGDLDPGRTLLGRLGEDLAMPPAGGGSAPPLPVISVGDPTLQEGSSGSLNFSDDFEIPFVVVGSVEAFPGSGRELGPSLVTSSRRLFPLVPPNVDPRRGGSAVDAGTFTSSVWSEGGRAETLASSTAAGIEPGEVSTAAQVRVANGLLASAWAASYLLALGAVVLVVVAAAALVLVLRLAARDTVSDVLLARMGWTPGDLARARWWEVLGAAVVALLAAVAALGLLALGPSLIDSTVAVAPAARPRLGGTVLPVLLGVLAAVLLAARLASSGRGRRRPAAEVLREHA